MLMVAALVALAICFASASALPFGSAPTAARAPYSHHDGSCLDGGNNTTLRIHLPPGSIPVDSFSWPALPPPGSPEYAFVLEQAILVLPPSCIAPPLTPNADNGANGDNTLWVGRLSELAAGASKVATTELATCGCGVAVMACGSGGCTGDNVRLMRALACTWSGVEPLFSCA